MESFLIQCLIHMCQRNPQTSNSLPRCSFNRILIEDSTFVRFPKGNADHFPGHGNGHGKTAGCKVDLAFDLLDGDIVYHQLHLGTEQDKTIGYDLLQHVLPGDLVVRDMGYFVLENFRIIESLDAYWLSRLSLTADVTTEQEITLEKLLASQQGDQSVALDRKSSPQHLKALVLAGMIAMSASLKFAIPLARRDPAKRFSLEKIFDYIIAGFVGLKNLTDLANLRPDPRHLQSQKRTRNSLNCCLMEVLG